jgi:hypothetical protein
MYIKQAQYYKRTVTSALPQEQAGISVAAELYRYGFIF